MTKPLASGLLSALCCAVLISCAQHAQADNVRNERSNDNYDLATTAQILLTSEAGAKLATQQNVSFRQGAPRGTRIIVQPDIVKQTITGIGTSFTESSAYVLAHLEPERRRDVMNKIFSEQGANFYQ